MPFIKLSPRTKQSLADMARKPYVLSENAAGEIFVDGEVYERLKELAALLQAPGDLEAAIEYLIAKGGYGQ